MNFEMKNQNIIILLFVLGLSSCSDFLEPKSQTEYVPRDINSLSELLIGEAYMDPRTQNYNVFCYNDFLSDDWACSKEIFNHTQNADKFVKYKAMFAWHPDMAKIASQNSNYYSVWASTYEFILGCNAVLDYVDKVSGTSDAKARVVAQALGLRAFYYFQLVNLFGEPYYYNKTALSVTLRVTSGLDLEYPKRATVEEVYKQIVADLEQAEKEFLKLPEKSQFIKDGTIGLPMVQLMRARTALFMNDYTTAITYARKIINDWGFHLYDLNSFISTTTVPYYAYTNYDNPEAIWLFGCTYDMARFYNGASATASITPTTNTLRRIFNASPSLIDSYNANDLREKNYINKEGPTTALLKNYAAVGKMPITATTSSYTLVVTSFGRALRLSEAYLILAEAAYFNGDNDAAIDALETLRQKRFTIASGDAYKVPSESASGNALFDFIKAERRREMCFEGLRWFDQRRWGMESFSREWKEDGTDVTVFTMEKNDPAFTMPIPFDAIEKNSNLEQNKLSTPKY